MKVLLINGSPNKEGCTYTALKEVEGALQAGGIETEMIYLGVKPVAGCIGCGSCGTTGKCFVNDKVNDVVEQLDDIDGIIVGSPVHYAAASGQVTSFMDRLFYAGMGRFVHKLGASVVSCRRGGATAAFDQLNKYFTISGMPVVSAMYWNQVHGNTPDEVRQDLEGMQTMRQLGNNMAYLLNCMKVAEEAGVKQPEREAAVKTNFIR